jgi:hypothetical protein
MHVLHTSSANAPSGPSEPLGGGRVPPVGAPSKGASRRTSWRRGLLSACVTLASLFAGGLAAVPVQALNRAGQRPNAALPATSGGVHRSVAARSASCRSRRPRAARRALRGGGRTQAKGACVRLSERVAGVHGAVSHRKSGSAQPTVKRRTSHASYTVALTSVMEGAPESNGEITGALETPGDLPEDVGGLPGAGAGSTGSSGGAAGSGGAAAGSGGAAGAEAGAPEGGKTGSSGASEDPPASEDPSDSESPGGSENPVGENPAGFEDEEGPTGSESPAGFEAPLGGEGSTGSEAPLGVAGGSGSLVESSSSAGETVPFRFFAPSSFWNESLPADAPVDPHSAEMVKAFDGMVTSEEAEHWGPWINTTSYSVPIYTVPANQPTVKVVLNHTPAAPALQTAWDAVPLPPGAKPAAGTDGVLVVWQPSTDRLWDFWRLEDWVTGWHAVWGGAMQNVSNEAGVSGPQAWPGGEPWWGTSASSLEIAGGLITLEDLESGVINHALSMAIPEVRAGEYASPAERDDGNSTNPLALPEGAHLRLNPNLNLAALHLPRVTLMIAEAAQRYGIFIRDRSKVVQFFAQDPIPTGTNPYKGRGGYFEGEYPSQLLASFPWSELQLLKMELH